VTKTMGAVVFYLALCLCGIAASVLMVRYDVNHIFHTHLPLLAELGLGVLLSEVIWLVTAVVWILVACGVLS
jgi:hypothetical protein